MSEAPVYFEISPVYRLGDTLTLSVERLREDSAKTRHVVEHVDVRVEDVDEDGVRLRWRPRWTEVLFGGETPSLDIEPELLERLTQLEFDIALDAAGRLIGISNEITVLDALEQFREALIAALPHAENLDQIFTARLLFFKLRRPIDLYFGVSGKAFPVADPLEETVMLPDPFGAEPYPAAVSAVAEPRGAQVLVHVRQVSPAAALLAHLAKVAGFALPEGFERAQLVDQSEYTVDAETGFTRIVRFTRTVDQTGVHQFDFLEIRLRG